MQVLQKKNATQPLISNKKRALSNYKGIFFFTFTQNKEKIDCNGGQTKQSVMSNISNALTLKDTSFERLIMALLGSMEPIFSVFN